ncbi:Stp1/IreP family PP2C-type Ser/Thr phosphatase [Peptostreptococcus equinus]|uniref:Stp1/IreP family PP2C-type Ser/Thr phosphatase n=1 Tax=Peptostreptococcus equinus TaxID=3003601 RepID=A0ABY7JLJ2_9FIRM|nr:Stp1/IreP family PP2C-type Ser/Thr phosphatase [Peptostreptococcus sp. CBA3647]WAW14230.1 Stp1/IreP family PP2C-type Ser/Thr phosphatase [Peptostreptococcus sp. CBA3647]
MDFVCTSHIGMVRKNNEDYCKGEIIEICEGKEVGVFAIADGMGGHNKGEVASQLAVDNIIEFFNNNFDNNEEIKTEYLDDLIIQAYNTVNNLIYDKAQDDATYDGMGTTLTMAIVYENKAYIANVGDSRCYLYKGAGKLEKITVDHSIVEEYVKANIITEEEARIHPDRNKITRAVGTEPVVIVDVFTVELEEGNKLLLATDGLTGAVEKYRIENVLSMDSELNDIADNLVELANEQSGKDNVTVIIVSI